MKNSATTSVRGQASVNLRPDFGTYHCSTSRESEKTRGRARVLFTKAFDRLPFSRNDKIAILDIGCGLGFLSFVCAEYYPHSMITGFDTFEHPSLKSSSLTRAKNNAKVMGLSKRIRFQKGDIFRADYKKVRFNLFVSNLVFHNLDEKRLEAYERLARWATPESYIVLGDLFFDYGADIKKLRSLFGRVQKRPGSMLDRKYMMLVLSEPKRP